MKNRDLAYKDYVNGMKYKDIANKYQVSINTVKSWRSRYWKNRDYKRARSPKKVATKKKKVAHKVAPKINVAELQKSGLTVKQQNFCLRYLQCYNATKAYKLAYGVSYDSARSLGSRLLANNNIQKELTRLRQHQINKLHFNRFDVLKKLIEIYNIDPGDFVRFGHETNIDDDGNSYERPYLYFRNQKHVDTSLVDEIKMGQNGPDIKVAPKLEVGKLLMKYLPDPINQDVHQDTLVSAFEKYIKNNSDKSKQNQSKHDKNHQN